MPDVIFKIDKLLEIGDSFAKSNNKKALKFVEKRISEMDRDTPYNIVTIRKEVKWNMKKNKKEI